MVERRSKPGRSAVGPDDLDVLGTMAGIAGRAMRGARAPVAGNPGVPDHRAAPPTPLLGGGVSSARITDARLLLSEQNVVGRTRMRFAKRLMLRGSRLVTHRLVAAAGDLADAVELLEATHGQAIAELRQSVEATVAGQLGGLLDRVGRIESEQQAMSAELNRVAMESSRLSNSLHAQLASLEVGVEDVAANAGRAADALTEEARELSSLVHGVEVRLAAAERRGDHDRSELHRTRTLVSRLVRGAEALDAGPAAAPAVSQGTPATLDERTYLDFEHRFRGSRDEIRARQGDAAPFISSLAGSPAPVLDLGCGRGEWLGLLRDLNVAAYGVDSNSAMVGEAVEAGLDARVGDALEHLDGLPASGLQGLTAFHFVEHVPLDVLVRLLDSALLALRPGGILLLETPNPTNLVVGAASFYLDPTHLRVLHPDFLAFLVESRGFVDVQIHYVHPVREMGAVADGESAAADGTPAGEDAGSRLVRSVEWALFGPQDYLLYARRAEVAE